MLPEFTTQGANGVLRASVRTLNMDNDFVPPAPVTNKLRRQRNLNWSDLNHVQTHLGDSLLYLSKTYKELSCDVLRWFQSSCFKLCVRYHKDPSGLERALLSIVDHAFGTHENCVDWCAYNGDSPANRSETFQPILSDAILHHKLSSLFKKLSEKSEEIAWNNSTGHPHMSAAMDFSYTPLSDATKDFRFDQICPDGSMKQKQSITTSRRLGLSESCGFEKDVCRSEERPVTSNELKPLLAGARCISSVKGRHATSNNFTCFPEVPGCKEQGNSMNVTEEENILLNSLDQLLQREDYEKRPTKEEHLKRNALIELPESRECEKRPTILWRGTEDKRVQGREEEQLPRHDLKSLSGRDEFEKRDAGVKYEKEEQLISRNAIPIASASTTEPAFSLEMGAEVTTSAPMHIIPRRKRLSSQSDLDHIKAVLSNSLGDLSKAHKELTSEVLMWFQTNCYAHCILKYHRDPPIMERALLGIVDHTYGFHENCGHWYGYDTDPPSCISDTFQPVLSDQSLKLKLNTLFSKLAENRQKVARFSSKKGMQSPKNPLLLTALKTKNLLSPKPLRNRLKDAGYEYLFTETTSHRVYQTKNTRLSSVAKEKTIQRESCKLENPNKRKKKRMKEKAKADHCLPSLDGGGSSTISETPIKMFKPSPECFVVHQPMILVFFDLETTSLAKDCEIVQLAAICGEKTFDRYILPVRGISAGASRVTGLTVSKGVLRLHQSLVYVVPLKKVLVEFMDWLKDLGKCLLVGHNSKSFDAPRLLLQLEKNGLAVTFCDTILGFLDTLPYFRESKPHLANHRQETLAKELLKVKYNAHRALDDVKILQTLVERYADRADLAKHGFSATWAYEMMKYDLQKQENLKTFRLLEKKDVLSKGLCEKMAGSGLREYDLRVAYSQAASRGEQGKDGIRKLLTERDDKGKIRVTNQAKVLDRIAAFYDERMSLGH
ncbi:uncharacterized protein [Ambystoma mexicanum]|uniref:uncharacterized protein n=1 Tax=Ambystoma mexicanum TaxID=8296 RepID=UPI0037E82184